MVHKSVITTVKDVDSKGYIIVAANAFDNVDAHNDVSMPGSFNKTLKENFNRARWLLNHNTSILLGVPVKGVEEYPYLKLEGQLNLNKSVSRDVYEDYKLFAEHGKSLEHSVGVEAIKWSKDGDIRKVNEWKLWEYSTLTAWGANENTPALGIKDIGFLELMLNKGNYTDERFKEIEKQINILKTLMNEPPQSTHTNKPKDNDVLLALKLYNILN